MFINNQGLLKTPNPDKTTCNTALCNITNCGHQCITEIFTAHHAIPRSDMKLLYVIKGPIKNKRNNITSTIPTGSLLYYEPDEVSTTYYFAPETEVYWIHFYGKTFADIISKIFTADNNCVNIGINKKIVDLFNRMISHMKFHYNDYEIYCSGILMQILGIVHETLSESTSTIGKNIQRVMVYIEENYASPISIKKLTEISGLSESFFFKSFKKTVNMTPYAYQLSLRLNAATEYLENTNLTIKEIGEKVGYDDPFTFSRSFKLKYGVSPRNYRNNKLSQK